MAKVSLVSGWQTRLEDCDTVITILAGVWRYVLLLPLRKGTFVPNAANTINLANSNWNQCSTIEENRQKGM